MMAVIYASIMMLWQWGSTRKHAYFDSQSVPLDSFLRMSDAVRTPAPFPGFSHWQVAAAALDHHKVYKEKYLLAEVGSPILCRGISKNSFSKMKSTMKRTTPTVASGCLAALQLLLPSHHRKGFCRTEH